MAELSRALLEGLNPWRLTDGLLFSCFFELYLSHMSTGSREPKARRGGTPGRTRLVTILTFLGVYLGAYLWSLLVHAFVPEPYLDEVFHIPQAQTYCQGRYWDWDDKITTPPGLYLVSVLHKKLWMMPSCSVSSLRHLSVTFTAQLALWAAVCRHLIETGSSSSSSSSPALSSFALHTAVNTALFPAIFFFSGLYYTDTLSTVSVLAAYSVHLRRVSQLGSEKGGRSDNDNSKAPPPTILQDLLVLFLGVLALSMRQTNVFWVVVYMGGLEAVHAVRTLGPAPAREKSESNSSLKARVRFYGWRYAVGDVHDPPASMAWLDDYLFCAISIALAAVWNWKRVLRQVWPHVAVVVLFATFVAWNGGVVLGDKSNHIATLHFAQMLYIWPFMAFFSAPLLIPVALSLASRVSSSIRALRRPQNPPPPLQKPVSSTQPARPLPPQQPAIPLRWLTPLFTHKRYHYPVYVLATLALSLAVVHYNTIVHPFTLADNRHYMFYVFRLTILRRGPLGVGMRYWLVPAYAAARWLVWTRLQGPSLPPPLTGGDGGGVPFVNHPFPTAELRQARTAYLAGAELARRGGSGEDDMSQNDIHSDVVTSSSAPPSTSTTLLWLLATALSLCTAPLVEPRYFILPWVFWRLLLPAWPVTRKSHHNSSPLPPPPLHGTPSRKENRKGEATSTTTMTTASSSSRSNVAATTDLTLWLEMAWFLLVNACTFYAFLFRGFYWRDATGGLADGGKVQRFMW